MAGRSSGHSEHHGEVHGRSSGNNYNYAQGGGNGKYAQSGHSKSSGLLGNVLTVEQSQIGNNM